MRVSVFGLGYVGSVTAACLARDGHSVVGVDTNNAKVALINRGESPVVEHDLQRLLSEGLASGRVRATSNAKDAVAASEASIIAVGTPVGHNGSPALGHVFQTCRAIAVAIGCDAREHSVVLRSTVPPGTLRRCHDLFVEMCPQSTVHLAFNPEFLREGSAIRDFDHPAYTVIGTDDSVAESAVRQLYSAVQAPVHVVSPEIAEMVKYVANAWHAAKISFANEVGRTARACGVDGRAVMGLIAEDSRLNTSPVYMRPGFAFGGSCLPKDLRALTRLSRTMDVRTPLLEAIATSNSGQVDAAIDMIMELRPRAVGVLGLAFKPGTDDLRESPAVVLVKKLLGEGIEIRIHDSCVHEAALLGTNLDYIRSNIGHFETLIDGDLEGVARQGDVLVVTHSTDAYREAVLRFAGSRPVVDLVGLFDDPPPGIDLHGIAW